MRMADLYQPSKSVPAGRIATSWLIMLVVVVVLGAGVSTLILKAGRRDVLRISGTTLTEVDRVATGHQRAERVVFADRGRLLAVTCPRYNRLVLYGVNSTTLEPLEDVELDGKPVAVCASTDRLYVLERPPGDERHVAQGWWQTRDFRGEKIGERVNVGFYPDDMALSPDGRSLYVLTSGRAEGDSAKPLPALEIYDISSSPKSISTVTFDESKDDPSRLTLSANGLGAVVSLQNANQAAAIDLSDRTKLRILSRTSLERVDHPYSSVSPDDSVLMPARSGQDAIAISLSGVGDCVLSTLPRGSGVEICLNDPHRTIGRLTLRGGLLGLGSIRPTGLAFSTEHGLLAVANRSGGVHLVEIRSETETRSVKISDVRASTTTVKR